MSMAWGDCQLCLKCCHSSLGKRERRTQSPESCKLSSVWACLCGKGVCRSAAKGRGCAQGACAAGRDSLCFQKVASICMAAMGEGKPADPSVFLLFLGLVPLCKAGFAGCVFNICLLLWVAFGSVLRIFSWFQDEQYCGIIVQQAPQRYFILRLTFWFVNFRKQIWCCLCDCFCLLPCQCPLVSAPSAHQSVVQSHLQL